MSVNGFKPISEWVEGDWIAVIALGVFTLFLIGGGLVMFLSWTISTLIGRTLGGTVRDPAQWGLDFAFTAVFLALLLLYVAIMAVRISRFERAIAEERRLHADRRVRV